MAVTPIVVLRSNDYNFLGSLRGLAAAGAEIVPVVFDWKGAGPWFSEASRHFRNPVRIPNPYEFEDSAVDELLQLGRRLRSDCGERAMVIPSSDTNLMLLVNHRRRLAPYFRLMGDAAFEAYRVDCIDKGYCADLLRDGGVDIPLTYTCASAADIDGIVAQVPYPAIYKPAIKDYAQTFYRAHQQLKAVECHTPEELAAGLRREMAAGYRLVVQEKIPFESALQEIPCYVYADGAHDVRLASTVVKESIHPAPFGTASVVRLTWQAELLPLAERVVKALRWRGLLMIEFIQDRRDGRWKVIEVNGRPWLFHDFWRQQGFDYLGYLYDDLCGRLSDQPALVTPSAELCATSPVHIHLGAELAAMKEQLAGTNLDGAAVRRRLRGIPGRQSFAYADPDDPQPGRCAMRWALQQHGLTVADLAATQAARDAAAALAPDIEDSGKGPISYPSPAAGDSARSAYSPATP